MRRDDVHTAERQYAQSQYHKPSADSFFMGRLRPLVGQNAYKQANKSFQLSIQATAFLLQTILHRGSSLIKSIAVM